ncbi:LysM peptidoglycan-binding domain-containing M23 family metallopeptidase [Methylocystis sp. IM3]|uniref:LysM peptidoglycan-binding domain-containing M23 family metallopeptidase n=1 Tax=unclassified Methylocystis TaxID=2625913 RepID=UPI0030F8BD06
MLIERHIAFSRVAVRLMMAAGAAALMAGCSDASRFSDPFSDPFSSGSAPKISRGVDRAPTGSIASTAPAPAPDASNLPGRVEARPLPGTTAPVNVAQAAPRAPAPAPAPVASAPAASTGGAGASHWTADGGTPVTVAAGETPAVLATRYGVPTDALLRANGYSNAAQVQPGSRLIIPVYRAGAVASSAPSPAAAPVRMAEAKTVEGKVVATAKPAAKPDPKAEAAEKAKAEREAKLAREEAAKAKKAETLTREQEAKRARKAEADKAAADKAADAKNLAETKQAEARKAAEAKAAEAKLAAEKAKLAKVEAAKSKADATAKAEAAKAVKEAKLAEAEAAKAAKAERQAKAEEAAAAAQAEKQAKAAAAAEKSAKVAAAEKPAEPAPAARAIDKTTTTASVPQAEEATKVSTSDPDRPEFRWPARGRIIQGFSTGGNDGINIAVPEGTPVKAAEGGQVAYAGSELKGYGNLVLIRHPNGYVTAYAHNGELEVKRGDTVKRGQTIAKSGQSGNVGSPQLHFELRKGATPVDPTSYLAGL